MGWERECLRLCAMNHTVNLLLNETLESETLQQTLGSLLTGSVKTKDGARLKLRFDNRPTCQSLNALFRWLLCIAGHYLPPQLVMTVNIKHQRGWWQYGIHESIHRNALPNLQCRISSQSGLNIDWSYVTPIIPEIQPNPLYSVSHCQQSCFFGFMGFEMGNLGISFQNEISHVCKNRNTAGLRASSIIQATIKTMSHLHTFAYKHTGSVCFWNIDWFNLFSEMYTAVWTEYMQEVSIHWVQKQVCKHAQ